MNQGAPYEPYGCGGGASLSPLGLSLDPPGGIERETEEDEAGPPPVLPQLQRQLIQQYRFTRLWLQRVIEERAAHQAEADCSSSNSNSSSSSNNKSSIR
ncbi:hypothetical protein Emag_002752 [Eimeria magna]